ncbi:imine reductase family protein [Actinomadura hibisca]|uniref:imine reductase family protein n=1 Tax=Actinomadura hibisca TaxID=68565 RepID=UPI0008312E52|nr:NAD(P)-binding domain-containing protein [Actinomadura hibisca]
MNANASRVALLGLGDMGAAIARAWLAAGHAPTVWNRTAARARPLAAEGATAAATPAEAVAEADLIVTVLLDDASVRATLDGLDLAGKDLVDLTTGTPAEARARAAWAAGRGARFLDGAILAVPPMIGGPGARILYSGDRAVLDAHETALTVPAAPAYLGPDAGFAALHDVALLSAMTGMFAGIEHAFALLREEDVAPAALAAMLAPWLTAMTGHTHGIAAHLESGDYTKDVASNLAMMVRGNATLRRTAEEQGVSSELLDPYFRLMERLVADGRGKEGTTGIVDLLRA